MVNPRFPPTGPIPVLLCLPSWSSTVSTDSTSARGNKRLALTDLSVAATSTKFESNPRNWTVSDYAFVNKSMDKSANGARINELFLLLTFKVRPIGLKFSHRFPPAKALKCLARKTQAFLAQPRRRAAASVTSSAVGRNQTTGRRQSKTRHTANWRCDARSRDGG